MHLISGVARNTQNLPRFAWNHNFSVVQMGGFPIPMQNFIDMVHWLLEEAERCLQKALQGLKFPDFEAIISKCTNMDDPSSWIQDDLQNNTPGYSFVTDDRNNLHQFHNSFQKALLNDAHLREKFSVQHSDGTVHIKRCKFYQIFVLQ
jgi:hypothetical protein